MMRGQEDGYDAIFVSTHKFLGGPGSPGILLMNESLYLLNGGPPSTSGGGTVLYVNGDDEEVQDEQNLSHFLYSVGRI